MTPPGRRGERVIHAGVVGGLECVGPGRGFLLRGIWRCAVQRDGGAAIQVAVRVRLRDAVRGAGGEHGVQHAERLEQPFLHRRRQRPAIHLLGNEAEQRVVGVAVFEACTGREGGRVRERHS